MGSKTRLIHPLQKQLSEKLLDVLGHGQWVYIYIYAFDIISYIQPTQKTQRTELLDVLSNHESEHGQRVEAVGILGDMIRGSDDEVVALLSRSATTEV